MIRPCRALKPDGPTSSDGRSTKNPVPHSCHALVSMPFIQAFSPPFRSNLGLGFALRIIEYSDTAASVAHVLALSRCLQEDVHRLVSEVHSDGPAFGPRGIGLGISKPETPNRKP